MTAEREEGRAERERKEGERMPVMGRHDGGIGGGSEEVEE